MVNDRMITGISRIASLFIPASFSSVYLRLIQYYTPKYLNIGDIIAERISDTSSIECASVTIGGIQ